MPNMFPVPLLLRIFLALLTPKPLATLLATVRMDCTQGAQSKPGITTGGQGAQQVKDCNRRARSTTSQGL
eukprot:1156056-Pelagomonas_calceolata.AAC.2